MLEGQTIHLGGQRIDVPAPAPAPSHPLLAVCALAAASVGCSSQSSQEPAPNLWPSTVSCTTSSPSAQVAGWTRYAVDSDLAGAAFSSVGDLNGDGRLDIVVSSFGHAQNNDSGMELEPGAVDAFLQGDSLDCWMKVPVVTRDVGIYFPNKPTLADVDGDGDLDVSVPGGFFACKYSSTPGGNCGALLWMENQGGPWVRHDIVPFGSSAFCHSASWQDFDRDGVLDLVTCGEKTSDAETVWYEGDPGVPSRLAPEPLSIGKGGGSLPRVFDVDGDGDLDIASAEYFVTFDDDQSASFVWFERTADPDSTAPAGRRARHKIDDQHGRAIMLDTAPDLFGDGAMHWIGANHTNTTGDDPGPESSVLVFDVPDDPTQPWLATRISEGIVSRPTVGLAYMAAPGLFGQGDIDGDGDIDIAVAGDGDQRTFWIEQTEPGKFATHVIEESLGQASGAIVRDLDDDGRSELIFTG